MALLSQQEITTALERLSGWSQKDKAIKKQYEFDDFIDAIDFVTDVAELAEEVNHHPDIAISFNKVTLTLWTHSEGGITQRDIDLATEIEAAAQGYL